MEHKHQYQYIVKNVTVSQEANEIETVLNEYCENGYYLNKLVKLDENRYLVVMDCYNGSLEHVQQRISSIQRRIAIYSNNQKLCPSPDNNEALEVYSQELCRLQKKYTIFPKLQSYARTGL